VDQETVKSRRTIVFIRLALVGFVACGAACGKKAPTEEAPSPVIASATATVPPVALSGAAPVSAFADASPEGQTPYDQALAYETSGQYWLARLVLEKKALGSSGTPREIELLARICQAQSEPACVVQCEKKLGRKLKLDAGAPHRAADPLSDHKESEKETDFTRARAHLLAERYKEARAILEPKVIDGKASKEEIRLLRAVCKQEGDRMCVALCDAKAK
jgi:hypothetical protein